MAPNRFQIVNWCVSLHLPFSITETARNMGMLWLSQVKSGTHQHMMQVLISD